MPFPAPSVSVPTLTTYQCNYGGLTLGGNTGLGLLKLEGLDTPNIRTGDAARPRDTGDFIGLDTIDGREITLTAQIGPEGGFTANWQALANATVPGGTTETPFYVALPLFGTLVSMARCRKRNMPIDIQFALGNLADVTLQLNATDPRLYSTPTLNPSCGLPTHSGLMAFPISFPLSFGGASPSGVITAVNNGNVQMCPILTVTGPCTNPSIQNASIAGSPQLTFDVTMASGDQLVIDTDLHTATYYTSGSTIGASRLYTLAGGSTWWTIQPGSNTIQFNSADTGTVAGTLACEYASAYII